MNLSLSVNSSSSLSAGIRALLLTGALGCFSLSSAHAVLIDFNDSNPTTGDLKTDFVQNTGGTGGTFSAAAANGISNTGSVATSTGDGTTAVYAGGSLNLSAGTTTTLSLYFYTQSVGITGSDKILLQLGVVPTTTGDMRLASDYLAVRVGVNSTGVYQLLVLNRSGGVTSSVNETSGFSLSAGSWYKLSVTLESTGVSNAVLVSSVLDNYGTDGSAFVSTVSSFSGQSFTNTTLAGDSSVYGAFRGTSDSGVRGYDNFAAVPEPSTLGLMLVALLIGAGAWRTSRAGRTGLATTTDLR